ncbi:rubrerythrin [Gottschalkia purinilytica]|uniref:Rubrerythrin n=1 Tax=Gottschalkia purinilytica TaxID=1503 RepID=A0A0L0W6Y8_GOTPU|nr:ferritin family protein [Gottschalkia purinilytica]KNF07279.1 rubrerythrin [Gottschalkia purinilytica]
MKKYEQVIRYAMQMELDGSSFFKEKAGQVLSETAKELFLTLADVEMDHYNFLKKHLDKYMENDTFEIDGSFADIDKDIFEKRAEKEHVDAALKESDVPDITILRMAYLIERDYKEFYEKASKEADDPVIKELFEMLSGWEAGHESIFKEEYDRRMKEYMTLPWGG